MYTSAYLCEYFSTREGALCKWFPSTHRMSTQSCDRPSVNWRLPWRVSRWRITTFDSESTLVAMSTLHSQGRLVWPMGSRGRWPPIQMAPESRWGPWATVSTVSPTPPVAHTKPISTSIMDNNATTDEQLEVFYINIFVEFFSVKISLFCLILEFFPVHENHPRLSEFTKTNSVHLILPVVQMFTPSSRRESLHFSINNTRYLKLLLAGHR